MSDVSVCVCSTRDSRLDSLEFAGSHVEEGVLDVKDVKFRPLFMMHNSAQKTSLRLRGVKTKEAFTFLYVPHTYLYEDMFESLSRTNEHSN